MVTREQTQPEPLRLEKVLQALGDPVRLGIVCHLARDGESSCAALDGGRPKSSMSHHFKVLREAGLVRTRHQGVTHLNALCRAAVDAAFPGLLDAVIAAEARRSVVADAAGLGRPEHVRDDPGPAGGQGRRDLRTARQDLDRVT